MMKKLPANNQNTIKRKLIALIGGQLLLFVLLLYMLFFWFQGILESKISALAQQTLSTVTGNIDMNLNQQILLSNAIASDSTLLQLLRTNPDFLNHASVWAQVELMQKMKGYASSHSKIHSVSIYNLPSGRFLSTTEGSVPATERMKDWAAEWEENSKLMGFYVAPQDGSASMSRNDSMITLLRKLPGEKVKNFLIVNAGKQVLGEVIGRVDLWEGTGILITDENGDEIFSSTSNMPLLGQEKMLAAFKDTPADYNAIDIQGETYLIFRQISNLTGWDITMMIPQKDIMMDVVKMKQFTAVITAAIGLVFVILSVLLYTQILNPIKKLIQSMVKVEKGLAYKPIEIRRYDELGFLQKRFNDMIQNEQKMRKQIMEEQFHSKEIELKFLQSQVNPHFLYNTLDSIYWVAMEHDSEELGDVVLDLSRYFRLSLSRGKEFVTIGESVEHLKYYLRIQQFRHTDKFEVRWTVDPSLEAYHIIKLMLQPIVENSIVHGMERAADSCQLWINIQKRDDWVMFHIQDTGVGMPRSELRKLLAEIKREEGSSEATYGLRNLYQRLKLIYGSDMKFAMGSLPEHGTRVTIMIHIRRLQEGLSNESHYCRR